MEHWNRYLNHHYQKLDFRVLYFNGKQISLDGNEILATDFQTASKLGSSFTALQEHFSIT